MRPTALAVFAGLAASAAASAQQFIMVADSTTATRGVHLLDPQTGMMVTPGFIPGTGASYSMTTPKHAHQVGNEIWVADQVVDSIFRFDLEGNYLSTISGGMDNIRGIGLIGSTVYVTNSGTANGAPGNAVVMFNTSGVSQGFFSAVGYAPSPFAVLAYQGGMLVSSSSANDDIHKFTLAGASLGTFHNSASVAFAQQMAYASNGDILVAGFSAPAGIFRLDAATGTILSSFAASGPRGVLELPDGKILWTNASGAHSYDPQTGVSTQVASGGFQYIDMLDQGGTGCYANCDGSTTQPILNVADFGCFLSKFAAGDSYANCDGSTTQPVLNVADFGCFLGKFAAGCR